MDSKELRYQIARSGINKKQLAKLLGIAEVTIHRKVNGKSVWNLDEIKKLQKILELDDDTIRSIFFTEKVS